MTRERAKELLPVIQAFIEGKPIQMEYITKCLDGNLEKRWVDLEDYTIKNLLFNNKLNRFRIKPEPREFELYRHPHEENLWYAIEKNNEDYILLKRNLAVTYPFLKVREVI